MPEPDVAGAKGGWGQKAHQKSTESLTTDPRAFSGIAIVFGAGYLQAVGALLLFAELLDSGSVRLGPREQLSCLVVVGNSLMV